MREAVQQMRWTASLFVGEGDIQTPPAFGHLP